MVTTRKSNGPAAAAILAASLGVFLLGALTSLASYSAGVSRTLNLWNPAGPLTGKTTVPVVIWLVVWAILHPRYRGRDVNLARFTLWAWVLILAGLLLTFPPIFEAFARE